MITHSWLALVSQHVHTKGCSLNPAAAPVMAMGETDAYTGVHIANMLLNSVCMVRQLSQSQDILNDYLPKIIILNNPDVLCFILPHVSTGMTPW